MKGCKLAGIGFILVLVPLFFVSAPLLKYGLGIGLLFDSLEAFCASRKNGIASTWFRRRCSSVG